MSRKHLSSGEVGRDEGVSMRLEELPPGSVFAPDRFQFKCVAAADITRGRIAKSAAEIVLLATAQKQKAGRS